MIQEATIKRIMDATGMDYLPAYRMAQAQRWLRAQRPTLQATNWIK